MPYVSYIYLNPNQSFRLINREVTLFIRSICNHLFEPVYSSSIAFSLWALRSPLWYSESEHSISGREKGNGVEMAAWVPVMWPSCYCRICNNSFTSVLYRLVKRLLCVLNNQTFFQDDLHIFCYFSTVDISSRVLLLAASAAAWQAASLLARRRSREGPG